MKYFRISLIILALLATGYLTFHIYQVESEKRILKEEHIELSRVKYGLFSVDEWKRIIADIISKKVDEFNFDETNKEELREKISTFLYSALEGFEDRYHEENSSSLMGWIRSGGANLFNIFGQLKEDVPVFTDQILNFMHDPENRSEIKKFINDKIDDYADKTFSEMDYTAHDLILAKYHYPDKETAIIELKSGVDALEKQNRPYAIALFSIVVILGLSCIFLKNITANEYLLLTLVSVCLLMSGLLLPMIDIDARISEMEMQFMGENLSFQDQVLYFKSKSILEVVDLMLSQGKIDIFLVGILVLLFSVIFPLSKLLSSMGYLFSKKLKSSGFIKFMVFKTGKWSMADVMVIAIFMAYIGFTGIISEQLKQLERISQNMNILTTNQSTLQIGFFLFTAFVILSLLISHKLQYAFRRSTK